MSFDLKKWLLLIRDYSVIKLSFVTEKATEGDNNSKSFSEFWFKEVTIID